MNTEEMALHELPLSWQQRICAMRQTQAQYRIERNQYRQEVARLREENITLRLDLADARLGWEVSA